MTHVVNHFSSRQTAEAARVPGTHVVEVPPGADRAAGFWLDIGSAAADTSDAPELVTIQGQEWWKIPDGDKVKWVPKKPGEAAPTDYGTTLEARQAALAAGVSNAEIFMKEGTNRFLFGFPKPPETTEPPDIGTKDLKVVKKLKAGPNRELWFLNNGESFFVDTSKEKVTGRLEFSHMIKRDGLDTNTAVLTDGTLIQVEPEKLTPEQLAKDPEIVTHQDGTQTVILNDGTKIRVGREPREATRETVNIGGRDYIEITQPDGRIDLQPVPPEQQTAAVRNIANRPFIQDTAGNLQAIDPLTMEQVITQAILNNDWEAAVAFDDFRNRPTSEEALQAAMDFSRSPTDSAVISALARGEPGIVEPHFQAGADVAELGGVRRIGPQPEFLQSAYQRFLDSLEAGRPPTEEERKLRGLPSWSLEDTAASFQPPLSIKGEREILGDAVIKYLGANPNASQRQIAAAIAGMGIPSGRDINTAEEFIAGTGDPEVGRLDQIRAAASAAGYSVTEINQEMERQFRSMKAFTVTEGSFLAALAFAFPDVVKAEEVEEVVDLGDDKVDLGDDKVDLGDDKVDDLVDDLGLGGDGGQSVNEAASNLASFADIAAADIPPEDIGEDLFDFWAGGGITHGNNLEIVGEGGEPELVELPNGTRVTPLSKLSDRDVARLKALGVHGMQEGGLTTNPSAFPLGVRQLLGGAVINPARSILPAAGIRVPSAQAQQRLLPSELAFLRSLSEEAGIPGELFNRELASTRPGRGGRRARFLAEVAN